MMRAAVIVNPAKADVSAPWEQVDKTLAAGWSTPLWLETTPEDPGRGMAEAAVAAGVQLVGSAAGTGRSVWSGRPDRAPADGRRGHRRWPTSQRADRARPSGRPRAAADGDGRLTE